MYGYYGLLGIIISNLLIGLIIYMTFFIVKKNKIKNYYEFINCLVGKNRLINYTINNIINIFLVISFIVMVSGFGAYFNQEFGIPIIYGAFFICLLALITFSKNINGIIRINSILIPCLVFLILLLGLKTNLFSFSPKNMIIYPNNSWIFSSVLYACYNLIILIPILINMSSFVKNKKNIYITAILTFIFMCTMSLIIYMVLCININKIKHIDLPIIYIANDMRNNLQISIWISYFSCNFYNGCFRRLYFFKQCFIK